MESQQETRPAVGVLMRRIGLTLLLLLLFFVGYKLVRSGWHGWILYTEGMQLLELARNDAPLSELAQIEHSLEQASASASEIERELRFFAPLLRHLSWIPTYGGTLAAAPELLVAGKELSALAHKGFVLAQPTLEQYSDLSEPRLLLIDLLLALSEQHEELSVLSLNADGAEQALAKVPLHTLHPILRGRFPELQSLLSLLSPTLQMLPAMPELIGLNEPRVYLVAVQNNHELRATGGLISALGLLTLEDGDIANLEFSDSYFVERKDIEYPWAPEPMKRYMGLDLMVLRDANWSPDLATSAQMIQAIYALDTGVQIDGVVTVDLFAVEKMIDGLGGVTLPNLDETITGETVVEQIKQFWDKPIGTEDTLDSVGLGAWWRQRKDFMPALAEAAFAKIEQDDLDKIRLVRAALDALNERTVQIWIDDAKILAQLARLGWDGGLHVPPDADFLALVDSNLGYNKVDSVIERALDYEVRWPDGAGQPGLATLAVTYQHLRPVPEHVCNLRPRYGNTYDDMAARCYYNYLRLYAPKGSQLIGIDGVAADSVTHKRGEKETELFAGYMVLKPGEQQTVTFTYHLPASIIPENYQLHLQRQSGTGSLPLELAVRGEDFSTIVVDGRFRWELAGGNWVD